jgi:hypothetical protein
MMVNERLTGTEQNTVKRKLTTGSERISTATQRLAAVAVARSERMNLCSLSLRYSRRHATAKFPRMTMEKKRRYRMNARCRSHRSPWKPFFAGNVSGISEILLDGRGEVSFFITTTCFSGSFDMSACVLS